jgi:hypothetical protein
MNYKGYRNYLLSATWQARRARRLESAGRRCEYIVEKLPWDLKHTYGERCSAVDRLGRVLINPAW